MRRAKVNHHASPEAHLPSGATWSGRQYRRHEALRARRATLLWRGGIATAAVAAAAAAGD